MKYISSQLLLEVIMYGGAPVYSMFFLVLTIVFVLLGLNNIRKGVLEWLKKSKH